MAKPLPNIIKAYTSKDYPQKAKGMSSFAFLFSVFIYISIFYIFKVSPSTLLNNHKFWFFISNTLIIIIAADYGTYSSCKEKHDLYEEYMINSQARNASSFVSKDLEIVEKSIPKEEVDDLEERKEVIVQKSEVLENSMELVIKSELEKHSENIQEKKHLHALKLDNEACNKKKIEAKTYRRSKSDKAKRVVIDESKNVLNRSGTEKHEPCKEENEFFTMSNEELNRRVEEFIQKCNRQMRLQNARNYQQI